MDLVAIALEISGEWGQVHRLSFDRSWKKQKLYVKSNFTKPRILMVLGIQLDEA
jgi:hypothetical protein